MTEDKWLTAKNPLHLLMHVKRTAPGLRTQAGRRKFRLFACGCARRIWPALTSDVMKRAVETSERFAEGAATRQQLWDAWCEAREIIRAAESHHPLWTVLFRITSAETWEAVKVWQWTSQPDLDVVRGNKPAEEKVVQTALARCIFGNPFRPITLDPSWLTSTVTALARGIYDERAFDRLPILADALQDAGCDNDDVLTHCRGTGPHARGCWVVDLVLGLS